MIFERVKRRPRGGTLTGWGLTAAGAAMVPWMYVLATRLPATAQVSNWSTAWVGLDAALAAGLAGTGVLYLRRDPRHGLTAAATAALLAVDAWFDVTTSAPGPERAVAVALAAGAEVPMAVLCAVLAARSLGASTAHNVFGRPPPQPSRATTKSVTFAVTGSGLPLFCFGDAIEMSMCE